MVGPAILYLPHGFPGAGFAVALPIWMGTTLFFLYASTCLLQVWQTQQGEQVSNDTIDIRRDDNNKPSTVTESSGLLDSHHNQTNNNRNSASQQQRRAAIRLSYPELAYRALGPTGESFVKTGIALLQSGVCLTHLILCPRTYTPPSYISFIGKHRHRVSG